MHIVVTSTNPVKLDATKQAFKLTFPDRNLTYSQIAVPSGVGDQPMSDSETLLGALNRVKAASKQQPQADYWVGLEGGIDKHLDQIQSFAWVVVKDKAGTIGKSRSATFSLPHKVVTQINQGKELGHAMDYLHHRQNSKQEEGAVGILTHGLITRTTLYIQPLILALTSFFK